MIRAFEGFASTYHLKKKSVREEVNEFNWKRRVEKRTGAADEKEKTVHGAQWLSVCL